MRCCGSDCPHRARCMPRTISTWRLRPLSGGSGPDRRSPIIAGNRCSPMRPRIGPYAGADRSPAWVGAGMSFTVQKDVMVAMRDGVELATDAWIPAVTPAPTLLVRLPYGKDLPQLLAYGLMPNIFALVEAGYAVVYQDCRGTFRSGGDLVPMLNEPSDGADTLAWLAEQPWCDGNIGTYGASYLGFVQWASASASDKLKAIAPAVTTTDYYTTPWYAEGGALSLHSIQSWATLMAMAEVQRAMGAGSGDMQTLIGLVAMAANPDPHLAELPVRARRLLEKQWAWGGAIP